MRLMVNVSASITSKMSLLSMTLEQLLNFPAEDLEKLTDADKLRICEENGWLKISRPELAPKPEKNTKRVVQHNEKNAKIGKAQGFLDKLGMDINLDDLLS